MSNLEKNMHLVDMGSTINPFEASVFTFLISISVIQFHLYSPPPSCQSITQFRVNLIIEEINRAFYYFDDYHLFNQGSHLPWDVKLHFSNTIESREARGGERERDCNTPEFFLWNTSKINITHWAAINILIG